MSGSSALRANAFENLKWCNVLVLLNVLRECELDDERHIERRYREQAMGYSRTAEFLHDIGIVARANRRIMCKLPLLDGGTPHAKVVLQRLVESKNRYRVEVFRYLRRFRISDGEVTYRGDASARSKESPVRNFLMDLGIIKHEALGDLHILDPACIPLYVRACSAGTGCSPARVAAQSAEQEEIGFAAEIAIVGFERERLSPSLGERIQHISLRNAAAGYDILSATATPSGVLPRYIEVKAVPGSSFRFFWTENEVAVASLLGPLYYLYLVPVGSSGELLTSRVVILGDPSSTVLNGPDWMIETNVRVCRLRKINSDAVRSYQ